MTLDAVLYYLGWAFAAAGWYMWWLESLAHAENVRHSAHEYSKLSQMFHDYRNRNEARP